MVLRDEYQIKCDDWCDDEFCPPQPRNHRRTKRDTTPQLTG